MTNAIKAEALSKMYRIGAAQSSHRQIREEITRSVGMALRRFSRRTPDAEAHPTIWALRDVSFTVRGGEIVGIIGRNGSGKSTLLKILSRITDPTEGMARVRGRVGSLLEVGTGFQPELTGRDNVFLNGSILGMRREEIRRRFDEIVDFSGVGQFIDTAVKHYSSGMYLRLAFAVAAHLDTEILLVDEVLAVGDQDFQQKCLGKMSGVAREGRTVLFVSHNMAAVRGLTNRCIWLNKGHVGADDETAQVMAGYLASSEYASGSSGHADLRDRPRPAREAPYGPGTFPTSDLRCRSITLRRPGHEASSTFPVGTPIGVDLVLEMGSPRSSCDVVVVVQTLDRSPVLSLVSGPIGLDGDEGEHLLRTVFDLNLLAPGTYTLDVYVQDPYPQDYVPDAIQFEVSLDSSEQRARIRYLTDWTLGPLRVPCEWQTLPSEAILADQSDRSISVAAKV